MGFFSKLFGIKVDEVQQSIEEAIVSFDPESAGKAEIAEWREELNKISTFVVKAQNEYEKELKETEAWKRKIDDSINALEILEADYAITQGNEKVQIEEALVALMNELDEANAEYEREVVEDAEAKEYLDELLAREREIASALRESEKIMKDVKRGYETQKIRTERAQERAEALSTGGKKLGTASKILNRRLEQLKEQEQVAKRTTKLTSNESVTMQNDKVKEALNRAKGMRRGSSAVSDRLAKLKAKHK